MSIGANQITANPITASPITAKPISAGDGIIPPLSEELFSNGILQANGVLQTDTILGLP